MDNSPFRNTPSPMDMGRGSDAGEHRIVHLDLKGAPPKFTYYEQLLPLLSKLGATGLLLEYEDMFPYSGDLSVLAAPNAYSTFEVQRLLEFAKECGLMVIPLVQTFGHLEFVLKHKEFHHLREMSASPMSLCPLLEESCALVKLMIDQVLKLHPSIRYFHIGADEVFQLGMCQRCRAQRPDGELPVFFHHVKNVCLYIRKSYHHLTPIMWDDMFRACDVATLKGSGLGCLVEPMVWHYGRTISLPPEIWSRLSQVFPNIWVASAFKGATGSCQLTTEITHHVENHSAWLDTVKCHIKPQFESFRGYAITGWQRYDHYAVLCELLPAGLPSLAVCLHVLNSLNSGRSLDEIHRDASADLGFAGLIPLHPCIRTLPECNFAGSEIYTAIQKLFHLHEDLKQFLTSDRYNGWLSDYHVQRGFVNPVHASCVLQESQMFQKELQQLCAELEKVLSDVFYPDTVKELVGVLVQPKLNTINKMIDTCATFCQ